MKSVLFLASLLLATCFVNASPMKIEAIPGKVKVMVDLQLSGPTEKVDVLFVIDDSGSMQSYQSLVAQNAHRFLDGLSQGGVDWRVGLISTTVGRIVAGLTQDTEMSSQYPGYSYHNFQLAVQAVGTAGDGTEKPFDSIVVALANNKWFVRPDAKLVIVLITDAEEQSSLTTDSFLQQMSMIKKDLKNISFYSFVSPIEWCPKPTQSEFKWSGSKFEKIHSSPVAAISFAICSPKFTDQLIDVGSLVGEMKKSGPIAPSLSRVPLPSAPDLSSISVNYGTQLIPANGVNLGWTFEDVKNEVILGNQIVWTAQPKGTMLEITYVPLDWK